MNFDASIVWDKSQEIIKSNLDPQIFAAWIKPLSISYIKVPSAVSANSVVSSGNLSADSSSSDSSSDDLSINSDSPSEIDLVAPNKFSCEHVSRHYADLIVSSLRRITGNKDVVVNFKVKESNYKGALHRATTDIIKSLENKQPLSQKVSVENTEEVDDATAASRARARRFRSNKHAIDATNLNPKYSFANYVVGNCNQLSHAASVRVASNLGGNFNPLFLYGDVGLGKTHLANAIGNAARRQGKNVLLVSSEYFVNELIASLRNNSMTQFKSRFRSLDLLIVDDIQFIVGKERTQEEFFHTFNELYNKHKQIVITSDRVPQELTGLEPRLRTRFASGLTVDVHAPDFETRVAILSKKAEAAGIALPLDVAQFLAQKIDSNVRELEGALNRLQALSSLNETGITLPLAEQAIKAVLSDKSHEVNCETVQKAVAEKLSVSLSDIIGKRRTQNIAFARHVAMYLCRRLTSYSYPEIGALFGGRDHSTVIHAYRVIQDRIASNSTFAADVASLEKQIRG